MSFAALISFLFVLPVHLLFLNRAGRILIGGRPIGDLNIRSLRASLGLVSQEPVLFASTIMENIRYGNPNATDEQVLNVADVIVFF
jgi:ABC-type multidrug transport system fused ATPase/permease subunit